MAVKFKVVAWVVGLWGGIAIACPTFAQNVTLDGTLGNAQTLTGPEYIIRQEDGQTVGNNLFHSFGRFGLDAGEAAIFQSNPNIQNILSRVTGGLPSFIDGLILTESASVNLFLINPSGIFFGANASIDIGGVNRGSFVATTADGLVWSNGSQFSATNPGGSNSLLTIVGDPSGFLSSVRPSTPINASGSILRVAQGQSIVLLGGDVVLDNSSLIARGGQIEIGGVAEEGTVGLNVKGNLLSLNFPDEVTRTDVFLNNEARLNVVNLSGDGGSITLYARNLEIKGASAIIAGIGDELGSPDDQAGDVTLNVVDNLNIQEISTIQNAVLPDTVGNSGNIYITTGSFSMGSGSQLVTSTLGIGNAGRIKINATHHVSLNTSNAVSMVEQEAEGNGGEIEITTDSLFLSDGSFLDAGTFGQGNAGSIIINATNTVSLDGSNIISAVADVAKGNGGDITITTGSLLLSNEAFLDSSTFGQGDGGKVLIQTTDLIELSGNNTAIFSDVNPTAIGNADGIVIETGSLRGKEGAFLSSTTFGQGNAGSVIINARDTVSFDGVDIRGLPGGIFSQVGPNGIGQGGNIDITTKSLVLTNGARLSISTFGQGDVGNINITATDIVSLDGVNSQSGPTGIFSQVSRAGIGQGGDINITTSSLFLTNGSQLISGTRGQGNAGSVNINATDKISFDGDGVDTNGNVFFSGVSSRVEKDAIGEGGDINITTSSIFLTDGAALSSSTFGQGNAGNINIIARDTVSFDGVGSSGISSGTFSQVEEGLGQGGDINIITSSLFLTNGAQLSGTTFGQGNAGKINITATNAVSLNGIGIDGDPSGIFSRGAEESMGNGGNISLNTQQLTIQNGATITASSEGTGNAGNILNITTRNLTLDNGSITTTSLSGDGGNIENLQVQNLLLLRNQSQISTTAGTQTSGGGNGGNININVGFIVAVPDENSDITANAFEGSGGNINITTNGIFGLTFRNQPTLQSDITASSQFGINGIIAINTPDINPISALATLSVNPVDAEKLVAENVCAIRDSQIAGGSSFVIIGKGGLPQNPNETLTNLTGTVDWATNTSTQKPEPVVLRSRSQNTESKPITPIQGWIKNSDGTITLTTEVPTVTPQNPSFIPQDCQVFS